MPTTQPIRNENLVRDISEYYLKRSELRNYILIIMALHTALRISDILKIMWDDVYDFKTKCIKERIVITENKTGKVTLIKINVAITTALQTCLPLARPGDYLFKSRKGGSLSRIQAYRIIRTASEALNFQTPVSCHSLRKTFGYHAWKNGTSPAVLMEIYNHSNYAVTRRYLGITQDDKDEVYDAIGDTF